MNLLDEVEVYITYIPDPARRFAERVLGSDVGRRLARGTFWNAASVAVTRAIMLGALIMVARILGKQQYGEFGIINSTAGMFMTFAGFGIGMTATKYTAALRGTDPDRAGRIIGLSSLFTLGSGAIASTALFIFAPWVAAHTLAAPHLAPQLRIGSLALFSGAVTAAQTGTLTGFEAFRTNAWIAAVGSLATAIGMVCGAQLYGLTGAVWGLVMPSVLMLLLTGVAAHRLAQHHGVLVDYRLCWSERRVLWDFSLPAFLAGSMVGPVQWACMAMIAHIPNGYSELGLFSAANQWYGAIMFIPGLITGALLPVMSERIAGQNHEQVRKIVKGSMFLIATAVVVPCIVLAFLSPLVMRLYGKDYAAGSTILVVSVLTAALVAFMAPVGTLISASGHMWTGFWMNAGWAAVFLIATWLLREDGGRGIAFARVGAYGAHALWTFWYIRRILQSDVEER